ncbi:MAG TPA: Gfo/Idh/MocA family oxidoreductase [Aridibacter sp.]|nr:Gfo/Idh/MocA family oxidoreductase [Aridibacter sp.]
MKDKIGIGFIGTGFAQLTQMPAFLECEGAELVSVTSGHIENAREAAMRFGISHVAEDWSETVEHDEVDLVCITTPPVLHHEMAMFAIERGKHILCEKPMSMNAEESLEMAEAAEEAGVLALIDHELRFLNGRKLAFETLRNGEFGKVIHAKSVFRNASRGNPDLKWNWWSDESQGGGALGAIGSHAIDGFRWLLGTEISEISCLLKTNIKERRDADGKVRAVTSDDECNFMVRFEDSDLTDDASGTGSLSMVEIGKYDFWTEIYGTEGSLIIGEKDRLEIARKDDSSFTEIDTKPGRAPAGTREGGWSMGFLAFAREIVDALREGRTEINWAATFRDGHEVQKVLDAARRSDESACRERVR